MCIYICIHICISFYSFICWYLVYKNMVYGPTFTFHSGFKVGVSSLHSGAQHHPSHTLPSPPKGPLTGGIPDTK